MRMSVGGSPEARESHGSRLKSYVLAVPPATPPSNPNAVIGTLSAARMATTRSRGLLPLVEVGF